MLLGRKAFFTLMCNVYGFIYRAFGSRNGWTAEDYKRRIGISRSAFYSLFKDARQKTGHREVNLKTLCVLSYATGIRLPHLIGGLVNLNSYKYDVEVSRREFRAHVGSLNIGLSPQFGLDQKPLKQIGLKQNASNKNYRS